MTPTLTISLPSSDASKYGLDGNEIRRLTSLVLHDGNFQFSKWTRDNLMGRLGKMLPQQFCMLVILVTELPEKGLTVYLGGDKTTLSFQDLWAYVARPEFPPTYIFAIIDDGVSIALIREIATNVDNVCIIWAQPERHREIVATGCEFYRWWGLKSLFRDEVDSVYLARCLERLVDAFNRQKAHEPNMHIANLMSRSITAWKEGELLLENVDYDTITSEAREEQVVDTLKRLSDASFSPRAQHLSPKANLICSQALFWFTELQPHRIDFDWLNSTRLAHDLYGGAVEGLSNLTELDRRRVTLNEAREFLDDFVLIPKGSYPLGSEDTEELSEPPAERITVVLDEFRILKRPVTGKDWHIFADNTPNPTSTHNLPVVHCTAFQALIFCKVVEQELRRLGLIGPSEEVTLPTEQQWEAAARGPEELEYPWGEKFDSRHCNCDLSFGSTITEPGRFYPKGDSPFGCQDMSGNVREWTRSYGGVAGFDWHQYSEPPIHKSLQTLRSHDRLIIRGGSYSYDPDCVKVWVRNTQLAERADQQTGFRLVIQKLLK